MTVQLNWPPEVLERLMKEARQRGLSLDAYVLQALTEYVSNRVPTADEAEKRRKREDAAARIRDLRKDVTLVPELTIRDLIHESSILSAPRLVLDNSVSIDLVHCS
jgi:hypothetical protein